MALSGVSERRDVAPASLRLRRRARFDERGKVVGRTPGWDGNSIEFGKVRGKLLLELFRQPGGTR